MSEKENNTIFQYSQKIDQLCTIDNSLFEFSDLRGGPLRDRMMEIIAHLGRYSELYDKARFRKDLQDIKVDSVRSEAIREAKTEDQKIPASLIQEYIYSKDVNGTSLERESQRLAAYTYAANRFRSICELIKNSVIACQTALNYDKAELRTYGEGESSSEQI